MLERPTQADARTDLDHGQIVVVTARWTMIVVGLALSIVYPTATVSDLRVQVSLILGLAIANFYLHAQLIRRRPIPRWTAFVASAADLVVISLLLIPQGGFSSYRYVLYFPALLALSVAFEPVVTLAYATATVVVYTCIVLATAHALGADGPIIVERLLMLAAVASCGAVYWRIERDRRLPVRTAALSHSADGKEC
jgi:hypothetical protein